MMKEEGFNVMSNKGLDKEGVEDALDEKDAIALARLDAMAWFTVSAVSTRYPLRKL